MDIELGKASEGPLKGIRVLDVTSMITGPLCSQMLGDLGAEVIKIEPTHGEVARWMMPPENGGLTGFYYQMNRNKRSLALNLQKEEGIAILKRLATDVDILVESFRPAYDPIAQGLVGMMHIQGKRFGGKPQLIQSAIVDKTTATTAAGIAMAALYARESINGSGRGQRVDVPMIDACAANSLPDMLPVDSFQPSELPDAEPLAVLRTFATLDGHVVGMALQDNHFEGLCQALECEHLLEREGMRNVGERISDFGPWLDAIEEEIGSWPTDELLARFDANGVTCGKVKTIREFAEDPQARHNRTLFDAEHPEPGTLRYVRYPGHFSDTPASLTRHPPRLGEHIAEILAEAGFSEEEVQSFEAAGVMLNYQS
ncbi:CoA transferase [Seongchinamella sediminis]|uniref:CoA transferase n=1 Tax=Seongchinamella sediminis TaxID=2283635 RepID=A0A3L7DWF1_9GAMM|nr:CoA transferase [Seongchinamella sediminis]RLQ20563.1 CoA transferase [Seongchinamella sediminis]